MYLFHMVVMRLCVCLFQTVVMRVHVFISYSSYESVCVYFRQ